MPSQCSLVNYFIDLCNQFKSAFMAEAITKGYSYSMLLFNDISTYI